jgi:hypothetical protein
VEEGTIADRVIDIDESLGERLREVVGGAEADLDGFTDREATRELERLVEAILPRIDEVRALLDDDDADRRRSGCIAFEAFGRAGWNDVWSLLPSEAEDDVRDAVVAALQALCAATRDPDADVREAALAVARWKGDEARAAVVAALGDPVLAVRAAAIASLGRRLPERAPSLVASLVDDETPVVEEELLRCLLAVESPLAVPLVLRVARRGGEGDLVVATAAAALDRAAERRRSRSRAAARRRRGRRQRAPRGGGAPHRARRPIVHAGPAARARRRGRLV